MLSLNLLLASVVGVYPLGKTMLMVSSSLNFLCTDYLFKNPGDPWRKSS